MTLALVDDPAALSFAAWQDAWRGAGLLPPPSEVHAAVLAAWSEPQRAYHTPRHLAETLHLLAQARGQCSRPDEVALALWFHDAVYLPRRTDNEERSAQWLVRVAREAGAAAQQLARLHALVLATAHAADPMHGDAGVLVDIDLAILGAPRERYAAYDADVRREYAWVPRFLYRRKRREVLQGFLARPAIYTTPLLHAAFERQARDNLKYSLQALG